MHRTWTWKIFSIATDFRGGAKERLRLLQSIKDFHGPPCSPATGEQHTTTHDSWSRPHCSAGSGITCTVQLVPGDLEMRWREPCVFFALQDRDEKLLVPSRVPPAVTSASGCFSPRSSPCKPTRRAWLGDELYRLANHGGTIRVGRRE